MELKGESVSNYLHRKSVSSAQTLALISSMLCAIESTHASGVVHRDIKPANFVLGLQAGNMEVTLVDFGLAKEHMSADGEVYPPRNQAEFRGTIPYASLASHFKKELGRKDDLWSFFFMMLELLD